MGLNNRPIHSARQAKIIGINNESAQCDSLTNSIQHSALTTQVEARNLPKVHPVRTAHG
jgi:hypothetical protein